MAGKAIRSQSGKKGVGMSAPGRPKGLPGGGQLVGVAPPIGLRKGTMVATAVMDKAKSKKLGK